MSRLRASLAPTETDRQIQSALDRAAREIEGALRLASEAPIPRARKRATVGDLRQALDRVARVRYTTPEAPERESYEDWRKRRDQKRQARVEARKARKEQADV